MDLLLFTIQNGERHKQHRENEKRTLKCRDLDQESFLKVPPKRVFMKLIETLDIWGGWGYGRLTRVTAEGIDVK